MQLAATVPNLGVTLGLCWEFIEVILGFYGGCIGVVCNLLRPPEGCQSSCLNLGARGLDSINIPRPPKASKKWNWVDRGLLGGSSLGSFKGSGWRLSPDSIRI